LLLMLLQMVVSGCSQPLKRSTPTTASIATGLTKNRPVKPESQLKMAQHERKRKAWVEETLKTYA